MIFTKNDLKTGDVILRHNGSVEIFIKDLDIFIMKDGYNTLSEINDDLTDVDNFDYGKEYDIVAVRRPVNIYDCQFNAFKEGYGELVYDRYSQKEKLSNEFYDEICDIYKKLENLINKYNN